MKTSPAEFSKKTFFSARMIVASVFLTVTFFVVFPHFHVAEAEPTISIVPGSTYNKNWQRVDSLIDLGLYKSADDLAGQILERARKEKNDPEMVKALMCRFRMGNAYKENNQERTIYDMEKELKTAKFPLSAVLHSMLGEMYWEYYTNRRWEILDRTQTVDFANDSIDTWGISTIVDHSMRNYKASMENADSLKKIPVDLFDIVIRKGEAPRELRPTLYDFLIRRAIDFFGGEEPEVTQPADHFSVSKPEFFSPSKDFAKLNIKTATDDSIAFRYYALNLYQQWLSFHLNDTAHSALIDADRLRLEFIANNYSANNKDSLYENSLKNLSTQFPENKYSADVLFALAQYQNTVGSQYYPRTNEEYRWEKKEAIENCDKAISKYPGSNGEFNCSILKERILEKDLSFTTEEVVIPNQSFPGLVHVQNIDSVYFRIAKMPAVIPDFDDRDSLMEYYRHLPALVSWNIKIPLDNDYQKHSAQAKFPAMEHGKYMLLASSTKDFSLNPKTSKFAYQTFDASLIAYFKSETVDGGTEFVFANRLNGEPLKNVKMQEYVEEYNKKTERSEFKPQRKFSSDKNGIVKVSGTKKVQHQFYFELEWKGNKLRTATDGGHWWYYDVENDTVKKEEETFFFIDRGIYRPGQTVFFKGIVVQKEGKKSKIVTGEKTTVEFYDANDQKVKSLDVTTNEYGSFSGSFVIPNNGVTGEMRIKNENGEQSFSVEEYKRPQFDITFNQVKDEVRIGDKVEVMGTAKTFSGAPLDQAKVKYSITRQMSYYGNYYYNYRPYSSNAQAEIVNGTISTNDTGGFVIPFTALSDQTVFDDDMIYYFSIAVDVTDISGETHSATKSLDIGKKSLSIYASVADEYFKEGKDSIWVSTRNIDGYDIPADVDFKIYKVEQPSHPMRERRWERPDKFIYTKEEWSKWFPEDIYDNEDDINTWKLQDMVFEKKFRSAKDSHFAIDGKEKWQSGTYEYIGTTHDKSGNEIKTTGYFRVAGEKETKLPFPDPWISQGSNYVLHAGETAVIRYGSAFSNTKVFYEMEQDGKIISNKWISVSNEMQELKIPIDEKMRGDFTIHFLFIHNGRPYSSDEYVSVPLENSDIEITFETFRDKLIPGQEEEWKLKVKGPKGEKIMAEMVAGMYDASLDEFRGNSWWFNPWNSYSQGKYWSSTVSNVQTSDLYYSYYGYGSYSSYIVPSYDYLKWFGYMGDYMYYENSYAEYTGDDSTSIGLQMKLDSMKVLGQLIGSTDSMMMADSLDFRPYRGNVFYTQVANAESMKMEQQEISYAGYDVAAKKTNRFVPAGATANVAFTDVSLTNQVSFAYSVGDGKSGKTDVPLKEVKARKNLSETVFFYPQLQTDSTGAVIIKFTMGEALTKWKFMAFAHTKDLRYTSAERMVVTQKDLMIMPNAPRFLREGDKISFTAKVINLSPKEISGNAQLQLFDAITMQPVDAQFSNTKSTIPFTAKNGQSAGLSWDLQIPEGINAVVYKVVASAGEFSDGEQNALPVLSNRMLVTETMPISVRGRQTKNFKFEKLISQNNGSKTLRNEKLTLEFTSNPAWYAVQALPYMMEYPYECAEQTFERYYANTLAANIANSSPKIRSVFDSWKNQSPDAFLSNLEKNQELKNVILAETPWVLEGKNETDQKKRVGLLFDMNHMADETGRASMKLHLMQGEDGGWPWFEGMPTDRYITQYIIAGFGHLNHLQVQRAEENEKDSLMIANGIAYMDRNMRKEYEYLVRYQKSTMDLNHLGYIDVQYLYARSFFRNFPMTSADSTAFNYFLGQEKKYWKENSTYMKGMIALSLFRFDEKKIPDIIMQSLKETALHSEELGMYWKENAGGYYWHQASVETQSLLIEAFKEIKNDQTSVDDMRVWLLKNKQTNQWSTTKSTADACYALLLDGTSWLTTESDVQITVGAQIVDPKKMGVQQEAGTGYFKTSWTGSDITPDMGNVQVTKAGTGISWGALYWQYFEDLDKITPAQTPLRVSKKFFLQKNTASGIVLEPVTAKTILHPGDKITVRVELRSDRDMEYVHMKDMRASGFEPVNVFSTYKYQDGLGYYESTKDASTDFFFSYLPKGAHVFEYPLTVIHAGDFSAGITQVQCMYAPEFSAHSEGMRVGVEK